MDLKISNIIIADTQFLIAESLKKVINETSHYSVLSVADNFPELKSLLSTQKTDLLITDFALFDYDGLVGLKQIREEFPGLSVLILTNSINRNELTELTRLGIKNIINKTTNLEELFLAIDTALKGKKYYCGEVLDILMDNEDKDTLSEPCHLTPAEIEVVKLIAGGLTTKEIAEKKHVSFHTVMSHRKNIFRKLNINNASELLMYAMRAGIIGNNIEYYI